MNCRMRVSAMLCCVLSVLSALALSAPASARTLYVSASGSSTGNGTRSAPFQNLAAVERASKPGDTIIVLATPLDLPPLEGGIALKNGQNLIGDGPKVAMTMTPLIFGARITNTTTANSGDAVVMADNASVSNLVILNARRSGIYMNDATGVSVTGNVISASNTSCTPALGYEGQRYSGRPMHGYAAVMADYTSRTASFSVIGNRIHDGMCMDGIHVRAGGNSVVNGRIDQNVITRLQQGKMFVSVLGIALETKDSAALTVTSDGNTQSFIGNPVGGVPEADCEGLLGHQTGGELRWTITHNSFSHAKGGSSCNGAEFFITEGHANSTIAISDSLFIDAQGDMLQNINLGTGETTLTMDRVTIAYTQLATEPSGPPESRGSNPAGNEAGRPRGHCVMLVSQGPGGANRARIADSTFSNCSGDGVFMYNAPFLGLPGASRELSLEIDRSTITTDNGYGLRWANYGSVDRAGVKVRSSFIAGSLDKAAVALMQDTSDGKYTVGTFDFGTVSAPGGNCIGLPGPRAVDLVGVDATFVGNFWGANVDAPPTGGSGSPVIDTIRVSGGKIDTGTALTKAPSTCGRM
jgi:hypothetical protein